MSRTRWAAIVLSFAAMLAVSGWVVWSQWARGTVMPILPLWAHALAFAIVIGEIVARALKIKLSAAAVAIPLRFETALRVCLAGDFAASVTPGRSGGEPARFLVLTEARLPAPSILLVLFLELFIELLSLIVFALGLWLVFRGAYATMGLMAGVVGGYAVFVLGLGGVGLVLSRHNSHGPPPTWARYVGLHAGRWRRIQFLVRHIRNSVAALRTARPLLMFASLAVSVVHVVARVIVLLVLVWSLDRTVDPAPLVSWPLVLIYGGVAAPAPGGGGVIEFGFAKVLAGTLTPGVLAASLIWWRFYTYYLYIVLGALGAGGTVVRALWTDRATAES